MADSSTNAASRCFHSYVIDTDMVQSQNHNHTGRLSDGIRSFARSFVRASCVRLLLTIGTKCSTAKSSPSTSVMTLSMVMLDSRTGSSGISSCVMINVLNIAWHTGVALGPSTDNTCWRATSGGCERVSSIARSTFGTSSACSSLMCCAARTPGPMSVCPKYPSSCS